MHAAGIGSIAGVGAAQIGLRGTIDDDFRREVIQQIMCNEVINLESLGRRLDFDPYDYFAPEFARLAPLEHDGLIAVQQHTITITDTGRLLRRNVAMVFDAYLTRAANSPAYSRAI